MRYALFLFLLFTQILTSQNTIRGKVIDSETGTPLFGVRISTASFPVNIVSEYNGDFILPKTGTYTFEREGYQTKEMVISSDAYLIVQMNVKVSELDEVVVHSNQIPVARRNSVASVEVLTKRDIERGNDINISEALNRVPGVFVQSGALNTNRFTIRGIGSRNLFGTSKIRAYFKDIPLTNGSGETTIEDFELAAISRVEILKGSTTTIYGAGLGGTIHLTPQNAYIDETSVNTQLTTGSFGLFKTAINFNHGTQSNSFRGVYSNTHVDGYRDNNQYNRQTLTFTSNHFINEKNSVTTLLSLVNLKAFIPSSLNEDDFLNDPTAAAFTWGQAQGFEDSERAIFGVTWDHLYNESSKQVTSVFGSLRNGYEPRPFNVLEENTAAYGIRSRFLGSVTLFNKRMKYTIGGEYFKDRYISKTFQNLYREFPAGTGSVQGALLSDFKENRSYYNLFFEARYLLFPKTTMVVGLNYNQTSYTLTDRFPFSDNDPDQSGNFTFDGILSPQLGLSQLLSENTSLYANISRGFSPLSLQETLLPDGQINSDLEPETGWNYEVGLRGKSSNGRLQWNAALYRIDLRNLLVSRRTALDQFIGVNAGKTQHDGLEVQLNYDWIRKSSFQLNTFFNYTRNDFVFKEFVDEDDDFSGNQLTGVPDQVLNMGLDFNSKFGLYGNINYQYVGSQPITDSNSLFSDAYQLTNIKIGYQRNVFSDMNIRLFFGINNIFDEKYASQILINASSFGANAPRYFYPGNPINYFGGLNINYSF